MTPELRARMGAAAVEGARSVNYRGAGTVEFLVDSELNFYFMEMNTRIQVEHPVTEEAYEVDLMKDQIMVAMGEKLTYCQEDIVPKWAVIECRINAEDVEKDFRPTPGKITALNLPGGPGVRVDTAAYIGYMIPPYYDSMIAKLIVKGRTRAEAVMRARRALDEFVVEGVPTTVPFHADMFQNADFLAGNYDNNFLEGYSKSAPDSGPGERKAVVMKRNSESTEPPAASPPDEETVETGSDNK